MCIYPSQVAGFEVEVRSPIGGVTIGGCQTQRPPVLHGKIRELREGRMVVCVLKMLPPPAWREVRSSRKRDGVDAKLPWVDVANVRTSRMTRARLRTVTDNRRPDVHSGAGDCCEVEDVSNERRGSTKQRFWAIHQSENPIVPFNSMCNLPIRYILEQLNRYDLPAKWVQPHQACHDGRSP